MADDESPSKGLVKQSSFVTSLKKHVFTTSNTLHDEELEGKQKFLHNYWIAITNLIYGSIDTVDRDSNVFKTGGLFFFHGISSYFARKCFDEGNATVENIEKYFREVDTDSLNELVMTRDFWQKGGSATQKNQSAWRELVIEFKRAASSGEHGRGGVQF